MVVWVVGDIPNPYSWSAWLLSAFEEQGKLFSLKKLAEEKKTNKDKYGVLEIVKDKKGVEWLLYLNLIEGEEDPHYSSSPPSVARTDPNRSIIYISY